MRRTCAPHGSRLSVSMTRACASAYPGHLPKSALSSSAMQQPQIPVFKPIIDAQVLDAARAALESGWLGMGSYVGAFEREIEKLIGGDRHVVAVSTGHAALHLALL